MMTRALAVDETLGALGAQSHKNGLKYAPYHVPSFK
jgi:hypothetical protein